MISLVFLFSSCSFIDFFSADSLLRAPRLTGDNAALQAAFEEEVGKDVSLFSPLSGDHRSAYILFDAYDDGIDEAIVFYSLNSNRSVLHMHLLKQENGIWKSVSDIIGSGTEVYSVDFFDIDDSDDVEIAVCWTDADLRREKKLSIYKTNDSLTSLSSVATIPVADYFYLDLDKDSDNELIYTYMTLASENYSVGA